MSFPSCPGGTLYTIQAGDTFFALSQRFNVPLDAILAANPGVDPQNLQIGQTVCIPGAPPSPPPGPCPGFFYVIQAGDTFFQLSQRFNVPLDAILAANPGVDPQSLQIGQTVCIPTGEPVCPGFIYTIQAGDTLFQLSQRFNVPVDAILAANPGVDPQRLQIGQEICIPTGEPEPECPGFIYTIQAGDTLFSLAEQFGVTVAAIQDVNPGIDPRQLAIGQRICIPARRCPEGTFVYVVRRGDTLSSIARRNNTTVRAIVRVNPGIDPDQLAIGQEICVPIRAT
ncbi:MAG: LysM peptidoglycan-binding domain-containing protein [Syntrophaceticus sp.]|jgi:peptidoglycan endopeptidase LytF